MVVKLPPSSLPTVKQAYNFEVETNAGNNILFKNAAHGKICWL